MSESPTEPTTTYEQAREELADVVRRLEAGGLTLEESLALWERGEQLAELCQHWLDRARERLAAATPGDQPEEGRTAPATVSSSSSVADPVTSTVTSPSVRESTVSPRSAVPRVQAWPPRSTVPCSCAPPRTSSTALARASSLTTKPAYSDDGVR